MRETRKQKIDRQRGALADLAFGRIVDAIDMGVLIIGPTCHVCGRGPSRRVGQRFLCEIHAVEQETAWKAARHRATAATVGRMTFGDNMPLSTPGDYCRAHADTPENNAGQAVSGDGILLGCSGSGRPSCRATECLYGAEPCPDGNHWKPEGAECGWCHSPASSPRG